MEEVKNPSKKVTSLAYTWAHVPHGSSERAGALPVLYRYHSQRLFL
jgi:hypothetical protein